jgi:hypothetical protein
LADICSRRSAAPTPTTSRRRSRCRCSRRSCQPCPSGNRWLPITFNTNIKKFSIEIILWFFPHKNVLILV